MKPNTRKSKREQLNPGDKLSALPDSIAHRIISFLGFKEACRTSVLSKRWTHISDTNPVMELSNVVFSADPRLGTWYNDMVKLDSFLEYTASRMRRYSRRKLRINKLTLGFPVLRLEFPNSKVMVIKKVEQWVKIAVRNQVAELVVSGPKNCELPTELLTAKSLRCLDCSYLEIPYYEGDDLFVSLESLFLHEVFQFESMLNRIISSCPLLKHLRLSSCFGYYDSIKSIVIPCSSKLEMLDVTKSLSTDGTVTIDTSTLTRLQYVGESRSAESWPVISKDGMLRNLRMLNIGFAGITDEIIGKLLSELNLLEALKLWNCPLLTTFAISSTVLKEIRLHFCAKLSDVRIDAPCLKKFKFKGDFDPSLSITINSQASCEISVHTPPFYLDNEGFLKLKKLLTGISNCNVLKISWLAKSDKGFDDINNNVDELSDAHLGPPCDIRELKLTLSSWILTSSFVSAFLDSLFWTCRPRIFSIRVNLGVPNETIEPLVRKLKDMANCGEHPLKRVEVDGGDCSNLLAARKLDVQMRLYW